uniref:Uncharacterized protein n=2 Tax=Caenorhabditis japonica TaxID=281687 RepID=A0A8R1I3F6_CAEJA
MLFWIRKKTIALFFLLPRLPTPPTLQEIKMAQKIANGFGELGPLEEYHYSFVQDGKLTLVGRKFVAQPTHNWGHRVAFAGTSVLTFDKGSQSWERHDFSELISEENVDETLFVRDDKLHLLVYTNFGAIEFKKLFRWENNTFVELKLTAPARKSLDEQHRTEFIAANGVTSKGETVLLVGEDGIQLYTLSVDGSSAHIAEPVSISREDKFLNGKPVLAEALGNQVLVSYGVHGCGFRWESSRFFVFNLDTKSVRAIEVKMDFSELPKYCFTGPKTSTVNPATNSWIVAAGSIQQGMTGSAHYGAVWALKNVFDESAEPTWVELPHTVDEGEHILDGLDLYTVTKDAVSKIQLDNV